MGQRYFYIIYQNQYLVEFIYSSQASSSCYILTTILFLIWSEPCYGNLRTFFDMLQYKEVIDRSSLEGERLHPRKEHDDR